MNAISIPPMVMATLMFYFGFYHYLIYRSQRDRRENLTFALSCVTVGIYAICCAGLYSVTSPAEGVQWQHLQVVTLAILAIVLLWFISDYTRQVNRKIAIGFTAYYILAALAGLLIRGDLVWTTEASIKQISLPLGYDVIYYEMVPGFLTNLQSSIGFIYSLYILKVSLTFYKRGNKQKGKPLLIAMIFLIMGVINDTAVSSGFYDSVYILEYSYIGIILLFTYSLTSIVLKAGKIEIALRESEAKFRGLVESTFDWIWEVDAAGEYTYASPKVKEILGYHPDKIIGKKPFDLMAPDEGERIARIFQELKEKGDPIVALENVNLHKKGQRVVMETSGTPIFNKNGDVVGYRGVDRDITERKQMEKTLLESEQKFRSITEQTSDLISITDGIGEIVYVSPSSRELFAAEPEDMIGSHFMEFLDETSVPIAIDEFQKSVTEGRPTKNLELKMKRKDGSTFYGELNASIFDIETMQGTLVVIRDITDRKKALEVLKETEEKLVRSKKMESLGLLAGGVAHDLNNVLSGIVSYPELILMDLPEDSDLRPQIKAIHESGQQAAEIVQDLLTIARGVAVSKEPLSLNTIIEEYSNSAEFNEMRQLYPSISFNLNLDNQLFNVTGSHAHIRKVVMNLMSNAAEAISGNGTVSVATLNRYVDRPLKGYDGITIGEYVILSVSDDGSGISAEDIGRIFEPFYTKKAMGRSGTGLGLAVIWNIVLDHKGYIDVNTGDDGTTFELYFPMTRDELIDKTLTVSIDEYQGKGERILVVDDVESQRDLACKMLEMLGYQTNSVPSGEKAIEYLQNASVDLILLDMIMDPGMNGRQTYEEIIKIHSTQKAVIVSGFAVTEDVEATQRLGAGQYIKKPYSLEMLGVAIKAELEKQHITRFK